MTIIGRTEDIPVGTAAPFEVDGRPIAVTNVEGKLFAFDDTCTHRGCSLSEGTLDGTLVTCRCHLSAFRITDGSVVSGPAKEPIRTYPLEVSDGQVSIKLEGGRPAEAEPEVPAPQRVGIPASAGKAEDPEHERSTAGPNQVYGALASVPLFADLDRASIERLQAFAFRKSFAAGEVIVEEGRTGNGLYVVLSGRVEVIKGLEGSRQETVAILREGEPFGEMALLGDWKRSASVRALEDVECLGMDRWAFLAHLKNEPNLAIRMLQMLADRLAATNQRLLE